ncbi:Concanavalin A-like lectin/glucanase, subgroup, partial [Cynara cardunculus var. scolymus]
MYCKKLAGSRMTKSNSFFHKLVKPFKFNPTKDFIQDSILLYGFLCVLNWKLEIQQVELEKIAAQEQKIFSFQTLVSATKNFHPDNKLGQGGYGPVFKGKLEDGREIAVKKLSQSSSQGKKEFINEAKLLARVQHRNVVSLLGFCGNPEKLLVDVYSFGVVVLELVSGEKNSAFNLDPECQNLLDWAYKQYKKGKSLEILESSLASSADLDQVSACIQIGLLCTQSDPQQRPTMRRVVVMLTRKTGALDEPSRPGYPGTRYRRSRRLATSSSMAGTSGASSSESSTIATSSTTMGTSSTSAFVVSNSRSSLTTTTAATGTAALGDSSSVPDWKLERPFFVGSTSDPH